MASVVVQADKNAGLAREAGLLEGKCQLKAALSSALESKAEVETALQAARLDQQRLQQEVLLHKDLCILWHCYCCCCRCCQLTQLVHFAVSLNSWQKLSFACTN